jgi:hypothetical protein
MYADKLALVGFTTGLDAEALAEVPAMLKVWSACCIKHLCMMSKSSSAVIFDRSKQVVQRAFEGVTTAAPTVCC